jgi:hypothetical protein
MNYQDFYAKLFKPVEDDIGSLDKETIVALVGFDFGGPLNLCTVGRKRKDEFITYVSCELAVRDDQQVGGIGPYELMMTCNDEDWCRSVLTDIGQMSLEALFEHGHTLDIGPWAKKSFPIQGIAFEEFAVVRIGRRKYGILRCHGITRPEMEFAQQHGVDELILRLREAGVYPKTDTGRRSIKLAA